MVSHALEAEFPDGPDGWPSRAEPIGVKGADVIFRIGGVAGFHVLGAAADAVEAVGPDRCAGGQPFACRFLFLFDRHFPYLRKQGGRETRRHSPKVLRPPCSANRSINFLILPESHPRKKQAVSKLLFRSLKNRPAPGSSPARSSTARSMTAPQRRCIGERPGSRTMISRGLSSFMAVLKIPPGAGKERESDEATLHFTGPRGRSFQNG